MAGAGVYVQILLHLDEEERLKRNQHRIRTRNIRDASNPFELPEFTFFKLFRLNKVAVQHIVDVLSVNMNNERRSTAIPNHLKILCALHFYGYGSYQLDAGGIHVFALSQPSVSRCISVVTELINNILANQWIKFSTERETISENINSFRNRYNFPGIVGVIDGTHVAITAPPLLHPVYPAGPYYNRKGYYSINVQIICNAKLEITNMNAQFPGSTHDSGIWQTSAVNRHLRQQYLNENLNYHLIGDEGYPLLPWLLIKHPGDFPENTPEGRFNISIIRARNIIERTIGILKGRFRCLLKHRTSNYNPIKAGKIIYACGVLHNMAIHFNVPEPDDNEGDEEVNNMEDNNFAGNLADNGNFFARFCKEKASNARIF